MSDKPKQRVQRKSQKADPDRALGIFKQFNCVSVSYDFDLPIESFKAKAFLKKTGIGAGDRWSAVVPTKDRVNGYHVHFKGSIESKRVSMTIEYWDKSVKRRSTDPKEPFAESIMQWVGSFVPDPSSRAIVFARFEKPNDAWRSRFNLPFKVTMAGEEVVIDGVSLTLPRNQFRAMNGWLTKTDKGLFVTVDFVRPIEFAKFNIADELVSFNEAVKLFVEQVV